MPDPLSSLKEAARSVLSEKSKPGNDDGDLTDPLYYISRAVWGGKSVVSQCLRMVRDAERKWDHALYRKTPSVRVLSHLGIIVVCRLCGG